MFNIEDDSIKCDDGNNDKSGEFLRAVERGFPEVFSRRGSEAGLAVNG